MVKLLKNSNYSSCNCPSDRPWISTPSVDRLGHGPTWPVRMVRSDMVGNSEHWVRVAPRQYSKDC